MSFVSWLVEKERRFAWSLVGTIVGFVSLYLAYIALRDKKPELTFTILGEANVFDVHTPLPNLEIRFQGQDIQNQQLNLRVLTIQVANTGDIAILQNQYDQAGPWGFVIRNGRGIEARVVRSNDTYLQSRLRPVLQNDSVYFEKPIFEKGSAVVLEALVLHPRQSRPAISPF